MWIPKKTKYKKRHKGRINITPGQRAVKLQKGRLGIITTQPGILYPYQFNALHKKLKQLMKKKGKLWFRVFPQHQKTKKSLGVRMGKGKGSVYEYFCYIRPYQIICEFKIGRVKPLKLAALAYKCKNKISLPTSLVYKLGRYKPTSIFHTKYLLKKQLMHL